MNAQITTPDGHHVPYTYVEAEGQGEGDIVMAHGLGGDRNEVDDLFSEAADQFRRSGFNSLRFDYRGNGESSLAHEDMTVVGEELDLRAVMDTLASENALPQYVIAASFGACSAIPVVSERQLDPVQALVLWNPVIDLYGSFIEPGTNWSSEGLSPDLLREFDDDPDRRSVVFAGLDLGRPLLDEMRSKQLSARLKKTLIGLRIPTLIFHGTQDDKVPFAYTAAIAKHSPNIELRPVDGASHGMVGWHDELITGTSDWLCEQVEAKLDLADPAN